MHHRIQPVSTTLVKPVAYDLANVIWRPFCFRGKSSSLLIWALPSWWANANFGQGMGVGRCYQQTPGRGTPIRHCFVISPHPQRMIFSLFSLKSFNIWPILMVDLLLHILLHFLTYDAVQMICQLTSYSTKKQQHWHTNCPKKLSL